MAFVITRLCRDCVDGSCVEVCPVEAIVEHRPDGAASVLPRQLFIDPSRCIDCSMCALECPWEAIYDENEVPEAFRDDIAQNAIAAEHPQEFHVPLVRLLRGATPAQVKANKARWAHPL
jgi:ferredoxin